MMPSKSRYLVTRRNALASLAAGAALVAVKGSSAAEPIRGGDNESEAKPVFSATGPNAELYGAAEGPRYGVQDLRTFVDYATGCRCPEAED
jgi:hypothetical protein